MRGIFRVISCGMLGAFGLLAGSICEGQTTYAGWIAGYSLTGSDALTTADPDADGMVNLMEYALAGHNPTVPDVPLSGDPVQGWVLETSEGVFGSLVLPPTPPTFSASIPLHSGLRWTPRADTVGLTFIPQVCRDMGTWAWGDCAFYTVTTTAGVSLAITRTNNYPHFRSGYGAKLPRVFLRLKVESTFGPTP